MHSGGADIAAVLAAQIAIQTKLITTFTAGYRLLLTFCSRAFPHSIVLHSTVVQKCTGVFLPRDS